jgi:hypothetical protein
MSPSSKIGTTVVLAENTSEVVVGADTLLTVDDGTVTHGCKIFQVGKVFFALAGFGGTTDKTPSIPSLATDAISKGGSIDDIATRFSDLVQRPLYNYLNSYRIASPELYSTRVPAIPLEIVFFGFEHGIPVYAGRGFNPLFDKPSPSFNVTGGTRVSAPEGKIAYVLMGHNAPLIAHMKAHPAYFHEVGLVSATRDLIEMAIADSKFVGGPISILRISADGPEWIEKTPLCPDLATPDRGVAKRSKAKKKKTRKKRRR